MKYSGEIKTGITGLITIIVIIWGVNYLKGRNILSNTYTLAALYTQVNGLESSAPVLMDGFKIGRVNEIIFEMDKTPPFTVFLEIEKDYRIKKESNAEIFSADLLGSKAIRIIRAESQPLATNGDTLKSRITGDMIAGLLDEVSPLLASLNSTVITLDSSGKAINRILNDPSLSSTISHLEKTSGSLEHQLSRSGNLSKSLVSLKEITGNLSSQNESISKIITNFESLSGKLDDAALDSLLLHLGVVSENLAQITTSIGEAQGTAGKLIYEDSLYQHIARLVTDLDSLVRDVNENPKKYVSISLIGR